MTKFDYRGHHDIFKNGQNDSLEIGKGSQMRELVAMVNRAIDPDAPYAEK